MTTAAETATDLEKDHDIDQTDDGKDEERRPTAGSAQAATTASEPGFGYTLKMAGIIAKREIRAFFDSLVAYVVIGGTSLFLGGYFFLIQSGGFWQVNRASMGRLFEFMPWALSALVIPLVTMRALAEEKRSGTLELLITMPVRDTSVILGKFIAAFGMCLLLLAFTFIYPFAMFYWPWQIGPLDWGPVWAGYLGLALFSAAGCALGIWYSSLTDSQIIAFFFTAGTLTILQVLGSVVESTEGPIGDVIAFLSFQSRFNPFGRGLIDTRAVVYFVSVAALALVASFRSLESRKWS